MSDIQRAMSTAIRSRIAQDIATSSRLSLTSAQMGREAEVWREALAAGRRESVNLTPLQRRFNARVDEYLLLAERLVETVAAPANPESVEEAVGSLLGTVIGHVLELETRVAAIESALR